MQDDSLIQNVHEDGHTLHIVSDWYVPFGQEVWQIYWYKKYPKLHWVHDKLALHDWQLSEHPTHFPLINWSLSVHVRHPF